MVTLQWVDVRNRQYLFVESYRIVANRKGANMASEFPKRVKVPDAGGDTITYSQLENGMYIVSTMEHFKFDALKNMTLRDDDVILCSYPRSGCHWLWEQLRMLHSGTTNLDNTEKMSGMFENTPIDQLDQQPSPRIFNTHLLFQDLPKGVLEKRTKLVFIYRNPKDVAVSYYHLHCHGFWWEYNGKFHNWLKLFKEGKVDWGSCHDYLNDWAKVIETTPGLNIHMLTYEGLKKNSVEELGKLSRFLGLDHDVSFLQSVTDMCAIGHMRERKGHYWEDKGVTDAPNLMYRQGKTNGWKDLFTVRMNEEFDDYWSKNFKASSTFPFDQ